MAVGPVLQTVLASAVRTRPFVDIFRAGARDVHRSLFDRDSTTVTLTLADIGATARGALEAVDPKRANAISSRADVTILTEKVPAIAGVAVDVADDVRVMPWLLLGLAILAGAGSLVMAPSRRRGMLILGVSVIVAGTAGMAGLRAGEILFLSGIEPGGVRDAADAAWNAFFGDLNVAVLLFAGVGVVAAAAAASLLSPVDVGAPLRAGWQRVTTPPTGAAARTARAVLLLAGGVLIVIGKAVFLHLVAILVGLYVAYAGVSELMRLTIPRDEAGVGAARAGRRTIVAAIVCAGAIALAGFAFIRLGGLEPESLAVTTSGCNGAPSLCDRTLDRVAIPATHNSMSAATYPGYLFAQQERGLTRQLLEGVRGLLIDAHSGTPTRGGIVKTDLSGLDGVERKRIADDVGDNALDAALRIRDRIVNSPAAGPRGVYLCHGFCEVGSVPIDRAFGDIRDFMAANPDEVLVVVIEDYVKPADIAAAARESGLVDYVYTGPVNALPTLRRMIDSGGRVLVMAENNPGGAAIPWYHSAYERLTQETPYSFTQPRQLTDASNLAESCRPERGPADAPFFLVNHWIDSSPAARPTNARIVNTREALLRRVHLCEKQRGLVANLVAVDFYREGDLFGAVEKLNDEREASSERLDPPSSSER